MYILQKVLTLVIMWFLRFPYSKLYDYIQCTNYFPYNKKLISTSCPTTETNYQCFYINILTLFLVLKIYYFLFKYGAILQIVQGSTHQRGLKYVLSVKISVTLEDHFNKESNTTSILLHRFYLLDCNYILFKTLNIINVLCW